MKKMKKKEILKKEKTNEYPIDCFSYQHEFQLFITCSYCQFAG